MSDKDYFKFKKTILNSYGWSACDILDVGCCDGALSKELLGSNEVFGLDNDRRMLEFAKKLGLKSSYYDFNLSTKIPFEDNSFDVILALDILEHLFDPEACLSELLRVLKDDGQLLIALPNSTNVFNRLSFFAGSLRDITDNFRDKDSLFSGHKNGFNKKLIHRLISKYGLRVESLRTFIPIRHEEKNKRLKNSFCTYLLKILHYSKISKLFSQLFAINYVVTLKKNVVKR